MAVNPAAKIKINRLNIRNSFPLWVPISRVARRAGVTAAERTPLRGVFPVFESALECARSVVEFCGNSDRATGRKRRSDKGRAAAGDMLRNPIGNNRPGRKA